MRPLLVLAGLLLVAGCSAGDGGATPSESGTTGPGPSSSAAPSASGSSTAAASDPCSLLTAAEVARIAGGTGQSAEPGTLAGQPICQWKGAGDTVAQVISLRASDWAASLPQVIAGVKSAGAGSDPEGLARLEKASGIVERGGRVADGEACGLFSDLLTIGGQAPGSDRSIQAYPSSKDAQSLTAQLCTDGRFTSLAIVSPSGLTTPLPLDEVSAAAASAHQRSLG
ncbi:DUF3558 family protein [Phycicoccus sp.]|uniref:DUF3558 family protein n=1 Tax=Phycicoccus sp. TaxID=1902410 RepID=UPI002BAD7AE1|nr:DUF3558 family protein [Phycicoccus sp.]HMM93627.1 DUF3558 family protein [Phycicoccus sp.]